MEVISIVVTLESRLRVLGVVTFVLLLASVGMPESIDSHVDEYVCDSSGGWQPFRCGSKMFNTACTNDDTILGLQYCLLISSISLHTVEARKSEPWKLIFITFIEGRSSLLNTEHSRASSAMSSKISLG